MTFLSRKKLGYAPSSVSAPVMLAQDIDELEVLFCSRQSTLTDLIDASVELETEARNLRMPEMIARVFLQRGHILISFRQYDPALNTLSRAKEILGGERQQDLQVKIYAAMAETYLLLQDWINVINCCRQGIALVERFRYQVNGQYLQSSYLRSRIGLYRSGVQAAYQTNDQNLMIQWADLSKCRSVLRQQGLSSIVSSDIKQIEKQFRQVSHQIDEARYKGHEKILQQLLAKRRTLWDSLLIKRNQAHSSELPKLDLQAIQKELAPDEAVLYYYWLDEKALLVTFIDHHQINVILSSLTDEQCQVLKRFADTVLNPQNASLKFVNKIKTFSSILLPDEIKTQLEAKQRLLISPHRILHTLPFQALPWNDNSRFLIQRFAITYIPNLTSLLLHYHRNHNQSLLAIGISDFTFYTSDIPNMENVDQEIENLTQLYHQNGYDVLALLNAEANENALHHLDLSKFDCLHFSTHGRNVDSNTPMESYLLLHDSVLEGLEIANWRLNADLAVLSACCSGQRPYQGRGLAELPGDDLFGLQAAFFAAGSKQVLSSLWPVDQDVAETIIMTFHRYRINGLSPERALQESVINYLKLWKKNRHKSKSFFWAPFFLTAVGRPYQQRTHTLS